MTFPRRRRAFFATLDSGGRALKDRTVELVSRTGLDAFADATTDLSTEGLPVRSDHTIPPWPPLRRAAALVAGLLAFTALLSPRPGTAQPSPEALEGDWAGELEVPGTTLRLVLHFQRPDEGGLTGTMDSPDQGAYGIATGPVRLAGDSVIVPVPSIGGTFRGAYREASGGPEIAGRWNQGAASLPLVLTPATGGEAAPPERPQEPEEPLPYEAREVTFRNASDGITLAGTFTLPPGDGPFPAVALISGSGPQDRDESLLGHRPFLVLADRLTRRGIAVLRYDDRGTAGSGGDFAAATSQDFARDATAAVRWLASRDAVDAGAVGLVGHSEGGLIAPMVSQGSDRVAFLVLLAGPALPGEEILYLQGEAIARAAGAPEDRIEAVRRRQERLFRAVLQEDDPSTRERRLQEILRAEPAVDSAGGATALPPEAARETVEAQVDQLSGPWFRFFLRHDPAETLRRVEVPVLALFGEKDLQVPADTNAAVMTRALERAPTGEFEVRRLEGLNHLFQHADTGLPSEYGAIQETLAPGLMNTVADWILRVTGRASRDGRSGPEGP